MSNPLSGLGTSSQTQNAASAGQTSSQVNPYEPAAPALSSLLGNALGQFNAQGGGGLYGPEQQNYQTAINNVNQLPNFGPAASQTAANFLQTGGDPTGLLRGEAANLNPIARENVDPTQTPGMQNVLKTIQADTENAVNGQFAGAGRSLSGLNTQTLARGLSQGEAVPLLNQYNANVQNMMGANQQLGNVQGQAVGNIGQAFNLANAAPGLATIGPMTAESLAQQERLQPYQYISAFENLINPVAGLGGTTAGQSNQSTQGAGTATGSILSQLAQGLGLLSPAAQFGNATGLFG